MIRFLQTQGRLQRYLLTGILALVCITMVIYLIPTGGSGLFNHGVSSNAVAKVDGQEITMQQLEQYTSNIMQQRRFPAEYRPMVMRQVLKMLVQQKIALSQAHHMGLTATDNDLRYELQHGPLAEQIYPNGTFIGSDKYRDFVAQFSMTVPQFEQELRDELTLRKLRTVLGAGAFVSDPEIHDAFLRVKTKIKFDYVTLDAANFANSVQVSDAELHAYYEKNQKLFANALPEERKIKYVFVDPARLAAAKASSAELQAYYRQHADEYRVPESVKLRHILIKFPLPGPDGKVAPQAINAAKAKAQDISNQIKHGGDFTALAKKFSDDPTSKQGNAVTLVQGAGVAPDIEKVAFTLAKGQTSDVIQTSYGMEILHIDDRISAHVRSLDEVRAQIEPVVAAQKSQQATEQLARKIEAQAKTVGLDKAATANGLKAEETGFLTRGSNIAALGSAPQFLEAVFGMRANDPATAVALPRGMAIAQVTGIKPPATPSFEQIKPQLEAGLKQEKAMAVLTQKSQDLVQKANQTHSLAQAAQAVGATVKSSDLIAPDGQVPDLGQVAQVAPQAFTMKVGAISQVIPLGQKNVVLAITQRQEPSDAEFAATRDQLKQALLDRKREELSQAQLLALYNQLEKAGKIIIDQKKLDSMAGAGSAE